MSKLLLEGGSLKEDLAALTKRVERLETKLTLIVRQLERGRQGVPASRVASRPGGYHDEYGETSDDHQCVVC